MKTSELLVRNNPRTLTTYAPDIEPGAAEPPGPRLGPVTAAIRAMRAAEPRDVIRMPARQPAGEAQAEPGLTGERLPRRVFSFSADMVVGCGSPLMPLDQIRRRLARIGWRGVRTATVRDAGGVPVVMTTALPEGVHAVMTTTGIEAVRTATGEVIAALTTSEIQASRAIAGHGVPVVSPVTATA